MPRPASVPRAPATAIMTVSSVTGQPMREACSVPGEDLEAVGTSCGSAIFCLDASNPSRDDIR